MDVARMSDLIRPGYPVLYMKVGMHAGESLEDILERKQAEVDRVGFAMWGYGGPTCPPSPDLSRAQVS